MQVVLITEVGLLLFGLFTYMSLKYKDRADLWRKLQCYSAARADAIEMQDHRYTQYKTQLGVQ